MRHQPRNVVSSRRRPKSPTRGLRNTSARLVTMPAPMVGFSDVIGAATKTLRPSAVRRDQAYPAQTGRR